MPETLETLILNSGLGLQATAEKAMVGRTSLWRWCSGLVTLRNAQAAALARALGCSTDRVVAAAKASREQSAAPA